MRSESKYKDWHPAWLVPGIRVWNDANGWAGEFLGFKDRWDGLEVGVFKADSGWVCETTQTYNFDRESLFVWSKENKEKRQLTEADNYQI